LKISVYFPRRLGLRVIRNTEREGEEIKG